MPTGVAWTYYAYDLVDNTRRAEIPFHQFRFTDELNGAGSFDGELALMHPSATLANLEPGATCIYVDRGGALVWGGIIWSVETKDDYTLRVSGQGLWSYWAHRTLRSRDGMAHATGISDSEIVWQDIGQFDIVKDMIDHATFVAATSELGLDEVRYHGPGPGGESGVSRTKTCYDYEHKVIAQLVEEIAAQTSGFDFGINLDWGASGGSVPDPLKYLDLYWPRRGIATPQIVLEHGLNCKVTRFVRDAANMGNPLAGIGSGTADAQIIVETIDTDYIKPDGPYPYLEGTVEYRDWGIEYAGNIERFTDAHLAERRQPLSTATIEVIETRDFGFGSIGLGDSVQVRQDILDFDVDSELRVMAHILTISDLGTETWEIDLAPEDATLGLL